MTQDSREIQMHRLTIQEAKKDFKQKRKDFLKGHKSEVKHTYILVDFWTKEEAKRALELAIKHDKLADPKVAKQTLDSLFIYNREDGKWVLDSTAIEEEHKKIYECRDCRKEIISDDILRPAYRLCKKCYNLRYLKTCHFCNISFYSKIPNRKFCKVCVQRMRKLQSLKGKINTRHKNEVKGILDKVEKGEVEQTEVPTCRVCSAILTKENWYPSLRELGSKLCRLCALAEAAEAYRKKKRGEEDGKIRDD